MILFFKKKEKQIYCHVLFCEIKYHKLLIENKICYSDEEKDLIIEAIKVFFPNAIYLATPVINNKILNLLIKRSK